MISSVEKQSILLIYFSILRTFDSSLLIGKLLFVEVCFTYFNASRKRPYSFALPYSCQHDRNPPQTNNTWYYCFFFNLDPVYKPFLFYFCFMDLRLWQYGFYNRTKPNNCYYCAVKIVGHIKFTLLPPVLIAHEVHVIVTSCVSFKNSFS